MKWAEIPLGGGATMGYIETISLKKTYATAVALDNVSLSIGSGEWVSIVGPSGSGKTTLMNLIGGIDLPTSGCVRMGGTDLCALTEERLAQFRRETIGYVFQQSYLIPYLSAVENVMLSQFFHSMPMEAEAVAALQQVGLGHRLGHKPSQLSGGEQQRVCIARALINSPKVIVADEPTGNLDRENTKAVLKLLKGIYDRGGLTILLVTHDPFVAGWGGRKIHMEDGRIHKDTLAPDGPW